MMEDRERQERARAKAAVDAQSAQVQAWIKANDLQRYVTRTQPDCATRWRAHLSPWPKRSRVHYSDLEVVVEAEVGRYYFRFGGVVAVLVSGGDNRGQLARTVRWTKPTEQKVVEALRARLWNLAEREVRDAEYRARCAAAERVHARLVHCFPQLETVTDVDSESLVLRVGRRVRAEALSEEALQALGAAWLRALQAIESLE